MKSIVSEWMVNGTATLFKPFSARSLRIKMPLGTEVGLGSARRHFVRWDSQLPHGRGTTAPPHFSAHVYCGQTVAHRSNC